MAIIGISDHGGWAILVTMTRDGTLLDRRRVELVDDALPALPHHHEGQLMPIDDAVALVERVRESAEQHAARALNQIAEAVPAVAGIALRERQPLPPTIEGRIKDHRARNVADWVMYRNALAKAAEARGWRVYWYSVKTVAEQAKSAINVGDFDAFSAHMRKSVGPPWTNDHKVALAAAIVAQHQ